jgi:hypothetical protein
MKVVLWSLATLFAAAACGPSFQALYEGDARFEHCYAMDESGSGSMQQKSDCWRDWTLHYTYGQTRDRVEYAAARYRALSRAPEAPTDDALMEAAPGEGRGGGVAAPAPTSAFAPPPKTLAEVDGGPAGANVLPGYAPSPSVTVASAKPEPAAQRPPSADCSDTCNTTWNDCKAKCSGAKDCDACTATYKKCMKGCFK